MAYYVLCDDDCRYESMTKEEIITAIEEAIEQGAVTDPDGAIISKIKEIRANEAARIWIGTESQFNALSPAPTVSKSFVRMGTDGVLYLLSDDSQTLDYSVIPVSKGGTGQTSMAAARNAFGLGNTTGALPIANGGTGQATVAAARNAFGLGNTSGALPIANGGTGQTTVAAARNALGLGNTSGAVPIANGGTGATTQVNAAYNLKTVAFNSASLSNANSLTHGYCYVHTDTTSNLPNVDGYGYLFAVNRFDSNNSGFQIFAPLNRADYPVFKRAFSGSSFDTWYEINTSYEAVKRKSQTGFSARTYSSSSWQSCCNGFHFPTGANGIQHGLYMVNLFVTIGTISGGTPTHISLKCFDNNDNAFGFPSSYHCQATGGASSIQFNYSFLFNNNTTSALRQKAFYVCPKIKVYGSGTINVTVTDVVITFTKLRDYTNILDL